MTDIEASTTAWDASPKRAKEALERQDGIGFEQVERNQGQMVEAGKYLNLAPGQTPIWDEYFHNFADQGPQ